MRDLANRLFSLSSATQASDADVYKALRELKTGLNLSQLLPAIGGWLILGVFAIIVSTDLLFRDVQILSDPDALMLLSGFVAGGLALLAFHILIKRIPWTLCVLWEKQYIVARGSKPDAPAQNKGDSTDEAAANQKRKEAYTRYIRNFEWSLNNWRQWLMGFFFVLLVAGWTVGPELFPSLDIPTDNDINSAIFIAALESPFGLILGLMAWRMLIVGLQVARIGKQPEFELVPRMAHPDRSGGLGPLGNLILLHVLPISITGAFLSTWIVVGAFWGESQFGSLAVDWTPFYAWLLSVPIAFAAFSIVVPLWSQHQVMVNQRDEALWPLAQDVDFMTRQILDHGKQMGAYEYELLSKNLELKQKNYFQQYKGYPIWPFNLGMSLRFGLSQFLPLVGGLVGLLKVVS